MKDNSLYKLGGVSSIADEFFVNLQATYPTPQFASAAKAITRSFTSNANIGAAVLVNWCARGKVTWRSL